MAMVPEKTSPPLKPKATATTFLGCFRLRSENKNENKVIKSRRSCFCLPRFGVTKAAATKTVVPLDVSAEQKSNKQGKFEIPAANEGGESPCVPVLEPLIVSSAKQKQKHLETESTETDQADRTEGNSDAQKRLLSFRRKVESIRTPASGSSQPGSPVPVQHHHHHHHHHHQETNKSSSPSATPLPKRRGGGGSLASSARNSWLLTSNETTTTTKRLDPLVGMTIIMVTLIIMLLWGRLCAILCTAAWFYLLPSLTQNTNLTTTTSSTAAGDDHLDFSSDEYKKKVILEGLLERNTHRTHHLL